VKLVSLNIWAGKELGPLLRFISRSSKDTDIFCFQEVFDNPSGVEKAANPITGAVYGIYGLICDALDGFSGTLSAPSTSYGQRQAIFTSGKVRAGSCGSVQLCAQEPTSFHGKSFARGSVLQWVEILEGNASLTVANVHGFWTADGKGDMPQRIWQSEHIAEFFGARKGKGILCGDLNLDPGTRSIGIIDADFRNLVKEYEVKTTRSRLVHPGISSFADYMFVSDGIEVRDFKVLDDVVSDHLPLMLEFGM
jgi:endonuclease/exonuclease/phosphatase family metal-dependent hydrolase